MGMKVKLKNIGGIKDQEIILKEGLNIISAPNAVGKTSFTHGIKVASLNRTEIFENTQFLNDSATKGIVSIDNKHVAITRRGGSLDVDGNPIFEVNGKSEVVFANPENEFLNTVIKGSDIEEFITHFSDSKYYSKVKKDYIEDVLDNLVSRKRDKESDMRTFKGSGESIKNKTVLLDKINKDIQKNENKLNDMEDKGKDYDKLAKESDDLKNKKRNLNQIVIEKTLQIKKNKDNIPKYKKAIKELDKEKETINSKYPNGIEEELIKLEKGKKDKILQKEEISKELITEEDGLKKNKGYVGIKCGECGKSYSEKDRIKRINELEHKIHEKKIIKNTLTTEISNYTEKIDYTNEDIKRRMLKITGDLHNNNKSLVDSKLEIERAEKMISLNNLNIIKLTKTINEIEAKMNKSVSDLRKQISKGVADFDDLKAQITQHEKNMEKYTQAKEDFDILSNKCKTLTDIKNFITEEIKRLQDAVTKKFNQRITEVYNVLGFKDFTKIEIDEYSYKIKVHRKGLREPQELNRLSTSERVTIGVIVMLAGKEEYLSDYPFFVLDEITTAYDPIRFKKIIDYIKDKTLYTIVTAFSPTGDKIKVEYKL